MASERRLFPWPLTAREIRLWIYLFIIIGVAGWRFIPRPWHPTLTVNSQHLIVYSTATPQQTDATIRALELLFAAYSNRFSNLPDFQKTYAKPQLKLYKNRNELRKINPGMGWVEAFYRSPYCHAYYSDTEINPYHWMLHEFVHQLNNEVAHFHLEKWLEEGLAEYFSTSRLTKNELAVGHIDMNTYPVWWIDEIATTTNLTENIHNGSVIPLQAIITNHGGPSMNQHFNLYYVHWWILTHFLFESPKYRDRILTLLQKGGDLNAFEQIIGPVSEVELEWHAYVCQLKQLMNHFNREFQSTGKVPSSLFTAPTPGL